MPPDRPRVILATDCGSTTTKAILIQKLPEGYRQTHRGEAPTTVEAPFEDVTRGILNAVEEVEELAGRRILDGDRIMTPSENGTGVDVYLSTSSAGGGLQMLVAGAVQSMTAESAQRAALGAGAIVMETIATNDRRLPHQKVSRIRELRPDMILLSGGTDGGTVSHVAELAEYIAAARPRPRLGTGYNLPVIFAGNVDARPQVKDVLGEQTALHITDNLRPVLEKENLEPAREKIQDLFLEHVMAHAPGYDKLMGWTGAPIMPTPAAVGEMMQTIARREGIDVLGVDIGGATTDVFSVFQDNFLRTVSANLGMSYSISNVLHEAGPDRVLRWLPVEFEQADLEDRTKNKMIRPTTIPQALRELTVEQALAREALSLAFAQHQQLATGLKGVQRIRDIAEAFAQKSAESLIDMQALDLVVGSGGALSHAPRRVQAMMMLMDAFQLEGVTRVAVDSIFMMPHLGVLSQIDEDAALEVLHENCLIMLGTVIAASGRKKRGKSCLSYRIETDSDVHEGELAFGDLLRIPLPGDRSCRVEVEGARGVDVGAGPNRTLETECSGGEVGLILDARGRPLELPDNRRQQRELIRQWSNAVDLYPRDLT